MGVVKGGLVYGSIRVYMCMGIGVYRCMGVGLYGVGVCVGVYVCL